MNSTDNEHDPLEKMRLYVKSLEIGNEAGKLANTSSRICRVVNGMLLVCGIAYALDLPIPMIERWFAALCAFALVTNIDRVVNVANVINCRLSSINHLISMQTKQDQ